MIGGDRHDRWAQTNTKLSWTQMFCAQKFFGPGKLFEPKILLDPNFFNPNFFGLLKTRSSFLGQWNVLKNNFILDQTFLFNPKYLRTPYFSFGPLNLDFECGTPSSACFLNSVRFENFVITRFFHTLTHGNRYNRLNFWDTWVWGKKFKFKFCPKFSFLIFRKSQEISIQ